MAEVDVKKLKAEIAYLLDTGYKPDATLTLYIFDAIDRNTKGGEYE